MTEATKIDWVSDTKGNKCSIAYFGSTEEAQKALDSLKNCENCTNCSHCSRCSDCSHCSDCSDCSDCSGCSGCSDCSRCSRCSGCSRCSRCSRCSGCSRCSHIAYLYDKKNIVAEPGESVRVGPPVVPVIPNIHAAVYAAASQPGSLKMGDVHTCENTHCRGGWVVTLAGEAGRALEDFYNWELAAMLIYDASDPNFKINPARFYDPNDVALADMKALAERPIDR